MPKLVNKVAHLITINVPFTKDGKTEVKTYRLMPAGGPVEVPAEAMKIRYTQAKMKAGHIAEVTGEEPTAKTAKTSKPADSGKQEGGS